MQNAECRTSTINNCNHHLHLDKDKISCYTRELLLLGRLNSQLLALRSQITSHMYLKCKAYYHSCEIPVMLIKVCSVINYHKYDHCVNSSQMGSNVLSSRWCIWTRSIHCWYSGEASSTLSFQAPTNSKSHFRTALQPTILNTSPSKAQIQDCREVEFIAAWRCQT